jgi:trigger factor
MPKTSVEQLNPTRVKLTVEVTADELQPHIEKAYKTVATQVQIPGFRKGKVPAQIIDQRIGKGVVVEQAVNDSLDLHYQLALNELGIKPMGRPSADVDQWLDGENFTGTLVLSYEVEVRPEFTLPKYDGIELTVDEAKIDKKAVDEELDGLRGRFGTLVSVDRPAVSGDFVELDLTARIDGNDVDQAAGISYELGSGNLLEGIDDAIDSLTAGESTTFKSTLLGGDFEGQEAEVEVTVTAVKERELPKADDEFAQMASEFDTLKELRASIEEQVTRKAVFEQGAQARDKFIDELIKKAKIPVSEEIINDEVHRHLEGENRLDDDAHRAEVIESSTKTLQTQLLLDAIAEAEKVEPTQNEFSQYIFSSAAQYGMEPADFIQALEQNGQIPIILAEVTRNKALAVALSKAAVKDKKGALVDLSEFTKVDEPEDQVAEGAESNEKKPAAKKPAAKKPAAKKPAAKKPATKKD